MRRPNDASIAVLKTLWNRGSNGRWQISDIKSVRIKRGDGVDARYFRAQGDVQLMTEHPRGDFHQMVSSFGSADFLLKQSILPVVAWVERKGPIRCVGTASVISATGYLLTAAHVLMDPFDREEGVSRARNILTPADDLNFGALLPTSPAYGSRGFLFLPFERFWAWGSFRESPLIHEKDRFEYLTDVAVCKVPDLPNGVPFQPLSLSLRSFAPGDRTFSFGYAEMNDIEVDWRENGEISIPDFDADLYVSIGDVMNVFPTNHVFKDVPAPGPCFDFDARIPGQNEWWSDFWSSGSGSARCSQPQLFR